MSLFIFGFIVVRIVSTRHYWPRRDSGEYISGAVAIERGLGFRDIISPVGTPDQLWAAVPSWIRRDPAAMATPDWPFLSHYPPLLPILLAPAVRIGGGRFLVLQLLPILSGFIALAGIYRVRHAILSQSWRPVLLLAAGSSAAVYATRVQSEIFLLPLVVAALSILSSTITNSGRILQRVSAASVVLLIATGIHSKAMFVGLGAAAWILARTDTRWRTRLCAAGIVLLLGVLPIALWTAQVTFSARERPAYQVYLQRDPLDPSSTMGLDRATAAELSRRLVDACCVSLESMRVPAMSSGSMMRLCLSAAFLLLLGAGWKGWRTIGSGIVPWCTGAYLLGCGLSPWFSDPRFIVPIQPFLIDLMVLGFLSLCRRTGRVLSRDFGHNEERDGAHRFIASAALLLMLSLQLARWIRFVPERDPYTAEYIFAKRRPLLEALGRIPLDRVVLIGDEDAYGYGLVTGHSMVSLDRLEWKQSNALRFLRGGGEATIVSRVYKSESELPSALLSSEFSAGEARMNRQLIRWERLVCVVKDGSIELTAGAPTVVEGTYPIRIHPRWMNLTESDRRKIWRAAFPGSFLSGP